MNIVATFLNLISYFLSSLEAVPFTFSDSMKIQRAAKIHSDDPSVIQEPRC